MSAVLKSFNQQLIDDEKNDHYGLRDRKLGSKSYQDASESSSESEEGEDDDEDFVVEKEEESAPEEDSGSDSDDDWATRDSPRKRARNATGGGSARKRARTYQPKWTVKARIRNLATDDDDGARAEVDKAERNRTRRPLPKLRNVRLTTAPLCSQERRRQRPRAHQKGSHPRRP